MPNIYMQDVLQKLPDEIEKMTSAEHSVYLENQRLAVFGADSRVDRDGVPVEQGLGSAQQPTRNSIEAYKRWHSSDEDFREQVSRMEANLAAYVAAAKTRKIGRAP